MLPSDENFYATPASSYELGRLTVDYLVRKYGEGKVRRISVIGS
jgi:hypothetical protein